MNDLVVLLPIFVFCVVIHEVSHAWVAFRLGDPTAKNLGRLTLNPIRHVSLFGSVLLPVLLILAHSPILFAWAKPVPIDPRYFRKPLQHMGLVAIAGPISNFILAAVFALLFRTVAVGQPIWAYGVVINVILGGFNLLPIPPLDGSRILTALLPISFARFYARLERIGLVLVVMVILFLGDMIFLPIRRIIEWFLGTPIEGL